MRNRWWWTARRSSASLGAPRLATVGGNLQLTRVGIVELTLPALTQTGDVDVTLNPALRGRSACRGSPAPRSSTSGTTPSCADDLGPGHDPGPLGVRGRLTQARHARRSVLAQINDHLDLRDADLPDLSGLASLTSVRALFLSRLPRLTDLRGLASLASVFYIRLESDPALASLEGLEGIHQIGGALWISSAPALTNLDGLSGLIDVGSDVYLEGLGALATLSGLEQLRVIGGRFTLRLAPRVPSLAPLDTLGWVGARSSSTTTLAGFSAGQVAAFRARLAH